MRLEILDEPSCSPANCARRLNVIRPFLAPDGVGTELGVFKGAFTEHLLSTRPRKLYLVDPWYRMAPKWNWAKGDKSTVRAFLDIVSEYRQEIEAGTVEPVVEYSEVFLANLPDGHLDWVYIDTSHKYEQTVMELDICLRKVKPGGYIVGDDFYPDAGSVHHGVYRAVKEFETAGRIRLLVAGDAHQFVAQGV